MLEESIGMLATLSSDTVGFKLKESTELTATLESAKHGLIYITVSEPDSDNYMYVTINYISRSMQKYSKESFIQHTGDKYQDARAISKLILNTVLGGIIDEIH